jgi:peptidoglycan/LPS O-acetylase OafA/YrhL
MNFTSQASGTPLAALTRSETGRTGRLHAYMPELDGLRAVAILMVVAFHLRLPFCSLGWAGVFLFFVLSGFLITGILLDAKPEPNYFRNFYFRRALRIFPIYYLTLAGLVALALGTHKTVLDLGWYLVYFQNYLLGVTSFQPAFPTAFDHSWSLAVEEQFYFLWPLAVWLLSRRALLALSLVLAVGAAIFRYIVASQSGSFTLAFTPLACVVDSLAAGAILAILLRSRLAEKCGNSLGYAALAVGGGGALFIILHNGLNCFWTNWMGAPSLNHLLLSTLAILFSGLILVALDPKTFLAFLLRLPPLCHLGRISYGLYMYHWPVLLLLPSVLKKCGVETLPLRYWVPLYLAVTYLVALASWQLLEKRVLALKRHFANHAPNREPQTLGRGKNTLRLTEPRPAN